MTLLNNRINALNLTRTLTSLRSKRINIEDIEFVWTKKGVLKGYMMRIDNSISDIYYYIFIMLDPKYDMVDIQVIQKNKNTQEESYISKLNEKLVQLILNTLVDELETWELDDDLMEFTREVRDFKLSKHVSATMVQTYLVGLLGILMLIYSENYIQINEFIVSILNK